MATYKQGKGCKGSLKWIQRLVNERPELLGRELRQRFGISSSVEFAWRSPLNGKGFAEYRDEAFLKAIGRSELAEKLAGFWPRRGPQWDALGALSDGTALLVEAKAHIPELISHGSARNPESIAQIQKAFRRTKRGLGVKSKNPWETPFYQYANRIAHLHFLKGICSTKALLVFVDFIGDSEMDGPESPEEWRGATDLIHVYLGIQNNPISGSIAHVCIDVGELAEGRTQPGGSPL